MDNNIDKNNINEFVDYIIEKTEKNVETIKTQKDEIERLQEELLVYKKLENTYELINKQAEDNIIEMKANTKKEAELIINEAKDNANKIINDALLRAERVEKQKNDLQRSISLYKKKIRTTLIEQLEAIEEIEIL